MDAHVVTVRTKERKCRGTRRQDYTKVLQRPEFVQVLVPPVEPDSNWLCGTAAVWRVPDSVLEHYGLPLDEEYCLCEHAIVVGD